MKSRRWLIRLVSIATLSLIASLYAYVEQGDALVTLTNTTFMIGLLLLVISGSSYVITGGFFKVSLMGWKRLLRREDEYTDRTHWSYDKDEDDDEVRKELRRQAKVELFITLPLITGIALIVESLIMTYMFLK